MRIFSRLKRRFLSQPRLARVIIGLILLLLVGAGLVLDGIIKRLDISLPGQINLLVWQTSTPPAIALITLNKSITHQGLDPTTVVASGGFTLGESLTIGNTRQPPTGGLVLAKSAASELLNTPVDYIVIGSVSDIGSLKNYSRHPWLLLWPPNYFRAHTLLFSTCQTDIPKEAWWRVLRTDLVYRGS